MRLLASLLLIWASGCGPSSYDDFRNQYTAHICATARRCGAIGHLDPCPVPDSLPSAGVLDIPAAISDGKLRFDSDKAQDCLDQVAGAPCSSAAAALRIYEHCHAVIGPNVAVGNKCDSDVECVGGTCDAADSCPGRCVAFPAPGSSCVPGECDPTVQYCGGGDSPTCQPHKGENSHCAADDECDYPFFCASGKCRRFPRTSDGKPCSDPAAVCNDGSYCSSASLCEPLQGKNDPCQAADNCKSGNGCDEEGSDGGVCRPWADVGQPCAPGLCPSTEACAANLDGGNADAGLPGICLAGPPLPGGPREPCTDGKCAAGLYCSSSMTCQWLRLRGGNCTPSDDGCAPGLTCDGTAQRCESSLVCPIPDGGTRD